MRVLVTGAGGFVGRRLVPRLEACGFETTACDLEVDVTDPAAVETILKSSQPEAIVHLAALSSVAASLSDPASCFRANYLGTRCLLQGVARFAPSARVLLIGSSEQYDLSQPGAPPSREQDPLKPRSPYARSKAAAEQLGSEAARNGLDVMRVRSFNHTGAGQTDTFAAPSFAKQITEIAAGRREPEMRVGNLDSVRDFLDVSDVIDAYIALLDSAVPPDIYNVASGHGISLRLLLDTLLEIAGVAPRIEPDPERMRPTDWVVGDSSRLRAATGWQPQVELRETLSELLGYWRDRLD
jgi:GDP-4-dehydro-6-deoxy-D-mannose reductase